MNKEEAEAAIAHEVGKIDRIRLSDLSDAEKKAEIDAIEVGIAKLVEITGPRKLVGRYRG